MSVFKSTLRHLFVQSDVGMGCTSLKIYIAYYDFTTGRVKVCGCNDKPSIIDQYMYFALIESKDDLLLLDLAGISYASYSVETQLGLFEAIDKYLQTEQSNIID